MTRSLEPNTIQNVYGWMLSIAGGYHPVTRCDNIQNAPSEQKQNSNINSPGKSYQTIEEDLTSLKIGKITPIFSAPPLSAAGFEKVKEQQVDRAYAHLKISNHAHRAVKSEN